MSDDPRLSWSLANPFGIVIDAAAETWWSGRVFDLVELDSGDSGVLLGTETGGMWIVDAANDALPLSNCWTNPNINCVAIGPDGERSAKGGDRVCLFREWTLEDLVSWF